MSEAIKHEELVELLQEGKIGYLRFVLEGESEQDYLEWWGGGGPPARTRRTSPPSFMWNRRTSCRWNAS